MNYIGDFMKVKKDSYELAVLTAMAILLIAFSLDAKNGAKYGLALSENIIIPSLLPMLMIFNLITKSGAGRIVEKIFAPFTEKVLHLPKCTGAAIVFGLTGGYPTGAILTQNLYDNNDIDKSTARRLLRFNINGGAAFIITAAGTAALGSEKAGLILFLSCTLASLLIAVISARFYDKPDNSELDFFSLPFGEALNKSVEGSIKSVLNISAYIILFSALNEIIKIPPFFEPFLEITSGVTEGNNIFSIPELAFLLSFSGLCIHFQIFGIIKKVNMKYIDFLLWRIIHALISYIICLLILQIFPIDISVFSNSAQSITQLSSVNYTLSVLMVLGCAVLVFDLESKKRKC